ncbi:monooxygenase [Nemania abortiva]|nr:monooxygenase [Nemania abortiva]
MSHSKIAPIAIIGGGPCGLVFARLLEQAGGIDYVVFERDDSAAPQTHYSGGGGTLDLHAETGQAALAAAGLTDEFEKYARREADVVTIQDSQGGNRFRHGHEGGVSNRPEIDRYQLRKILLESIPAHRVRWGKTLKAIERDESVKDAADAKGWRLCFTDGSTETGFRLVVGADGAFSKVRPVITPAKPIYSGKSYIEGRITHANPHYAEAQEMAGPGMWGSIGAGHMLAVQQMGDRTYRLYAGIEEPEALTRPGGALDFTADIEKSKAALLGLYEGWAPNLRALIQDAEGPWRVWPLYTFQPEVFAPDTVKENWVHAPGLTLLGDAAHVALPNGEGVNIAMLDALKLFECLATELGIKASGGSKSGNQGKVFDPSVDAAAVERAIVAYETGMLKRAYEHILEGFQQMEMMYQADGAQRMIAMFKQFSEEAGQS